MDTTADFHQTRKRERDESDSVTEENQKKICHTTSTSTSVESLNQLTDKLIINDNWNQIKDGLLVIFSQKKIDKALYSQTLTHIFNYFTTSTILPKTNNLFLPERTQLFGTHLYKHLENFLIYHIKQIQNSCDELTGDDFLTKYFTSFEDYQFSSKRLNNLCRAFNKYWMQWQRRINTNSVSTVYQLAMVVWRDYIFLSLHQKISNLILNVIERQRNGEYFKIDFLKLHLKYYVDSVFDNDTTEKKEALNSFRSEFEEAIISETEAFYCKESIVFLDMPKPITKYVDRIHQRLLEEEERFKDNFTKDMKEKMFAKLKKVFIQDHLTILGNRSKELTFDCNTDFQKVYHLLSSYTNFMELLGEEFHKQIVLQGNSAIEKCVDVAEKDPESYVKAVLDVYNRFYEMVTRYFNSNVAFKETLEKACEKFINFNVFSKLGGVNEKSAELLVKYCDNLLQKNNNNDEGILEESLNKVLFIFKYLEDKEIFLTFYTKSLVIRLIRHNFCVDAETFMISKLKKVCGYYYIKDLENIVKDSVLSKQLNESFKSTVLRDDPLGMDFTVKILMKVHTPLKDAYQFQFPKELEKPVTRFNCFYRNIHSGRKLDWLTSFSTGELQSNCFKNQHTFKATTIQIAVLLQFNENISFTVQQLCNNISISERELLEVLKNLIKQKLLVSKDGENNLHVDSQVDLSTSYINKKLKINITSILKTDVQRDKIYMCKSLEKHREMLMQTAIVRVMKTRRYLSHQALLAEVFEQLTIKFIPSVTLFRKCINILIDKEYLEKKKGTDISYSYKA